MAEGSNGMSMFDYDARPVTPQVVLIGDRGSSVGYSIRDFLSRNGVPYEWVDLDDGERVGALASPGELDPGLLPLCILPDGRRLAPATVEHVAAGLGMVSAPSSSAYDLIVVGAGPAGLAAAVYAASEGLRAVAIEAVAPGGQAGTTSMIENYLGFPQGISGSELATRATAQARRFGAEILLARRLMNVSEDARGYVVHLSDGTSVGSPALLLASGVEWRRLAIPGLDDLLGSGVFYGAGPSEAVTCTGGHVAVVGGGNSAGQAVIRFSRYATHVTLLVRGSSLEASMSQYLISQIRNLSNVDVRTNTEVVDLESDGSLRALIVASGVDGVRSRLPVEALFVCIGGVPRTEGAARAGLAVDDAGYLRTGADVSSSPGALDGWPLSRPPLPLETNRPGLFAAGDVRSGSIKRCAAAIGEGSMAVALVHQRLAEVGRE
jgi:thioredoxin reductase (NADPH)